jgi:tetratricopeptide (TPR) repeat protein
MRTLVALVVYASISAAATISGSAGQENLASNTWLMKHNTGLAAMKESRFEEAAQRFEECWTLSRTSLERGLAANDTGMALKKLGRMPEAVPWLERALNEWNGNADRFAQTSRALYDAYRRWGDYVAAERVLRNAIARNCSPGIHVVLATDLGDLLREQGRALEAGPLFESVVKDSSASPESRAWALLGLSDIERQQNAWQASVQHAMAVARLAREKDDLELEAIALRAMGNGWLDARDLAQAEPALRRSLEIFQKLPEAGAEQTSDVLASLGFLYRIENKPGLAADALERALNMKRLALGPEHPQLALILELLADVRSSTGESDAARALMQQCMAILNRRLGEQSVPMAVALSNAAEIELRGGQLEAAADDYGRALGMFRQLGAERAVLMLQVMDRYASLLKRMHRGREAKTLRNEAKAIREQWPALPATISAESFLADERRGR